MEKFYMIVAGILLTAILTVTLHRYNGEIAILLGLCGSCLVVITALDFVRPVLAFMNRLQQLGSLDQQMVAIVLKVTAVSFTAEIAGTVLSDCGNSALAKSLQVFSSILILYLSLPMFQALLDLVERILSGL